MTSEITISLFKLKNHKPAAPFDCGIKAINSFARDPAKLLRRDKAKYDNPRRWCLLARDNGGNVCALVYFSQEGSDNSFIASRFGPLEETHNLKPGRMAYIHYLGVDALYQKHGLYGGLNLGTRMIAEVMCFFEKMEKPIRAIGLHAIDEYISEKLGATHLPSSQRFYEKLGFEAIEDRPLRFRDEQYYGPPMLLHLAHAARHGLRAMCSVPLVIRKNIGGHHRSPRRTRLPSADNDG